MTLKIQHKRSAVKAKAPQPTDLEYGEIAVNYEKSDPCIYIKDSANKIRRIGAQPGVLVFKGAVAPTSTAPAAPDTGNVYIMNAAGVMAASWTGMAGKNVAKNENIAWSGTQWESLGAAYNSASISTSATPPATPTAGDMWWNSDDGRLYIYYKDADSSQWVDASPDSPSSPPPAALWERTGTTISPATAGDSLDVGAFTVDGAAPAGNVKIQAGGALSSKGPFVSVGAAEDGTAGHTNAGVLISSSGYLNLRKAGDSGTALAVHGSGGNARVSLQASGNSLFDVTKDGLRVSSPNGGAYALLARQGTTDNVRIQFDGNCMKPGGGAWNAISDQRAKENIADYNAGLAELLQLEPRTYKYIGSEGEYVGLIAQECEKVLPEMVMTGKGNLPDGTEVDDYRTLNQTPLTFALINAVKELSAQIKTLETKVAALEGGAH